MEKRLYVELHTRDTSVPVYIVKIVMEDLGYWVKEVLMDSPHNTEVLHKNMLMSMEGTIVDVDGVDVDLSVLVDALIEQDTPEGENICENYLYEVVDRIYAGLIEKGEYTLDGGNELRFRLLEVGEDE